VRSNKTVGILSDQKIILLLILVGAVLSLRSPYFLTVDNLLNVLLSIAIEGIIVLGMTYLIIIGELDLSVGSTMALAGVLAVVLQKYGVITAVAAGIAAGFVVGIVNGILVTRIRITSLAATLGMMILLSGVVFALTQSQTLKGTNSDYALIAQSSLAGIPVPIVVFLVLSVVLGLVLRHSYFGRGVYAVGGNATAARFFGVKVVRTRIAAFALTGFLSGIAGVLLAAKLNIASGIIGQNTAVVVITAVLLGGISLSGGEGNIFKAVQGILLVGVLNNALILLLISPFVQDIIRGALLILLIVFDSLNSKRLRFR
jgi:ribose/xylose/arabinose/galactoside ABC-type transport system permease subunit